MTTEEKTFREYTKAQGDAYAAGRPGYPPELFKVIINHHTSTGGELDTVVDIGCGTGQATQDLAPYFANTIGLDPSDGMVGAARAQAESAGLPIRFEVSAAEALGANLEPPIADCSVDLLTAATSAHWFDMDHFWPSAMRVLKPGGTVALWARTGLAIDHINTPNGAAIKAVVDEAFNRDLRPYALKGNIITRNLYVDLPLPWDLKIPVDGFDKETFFRKEWTGHTEGTAEDGIGMSKAITPEEFEKRLSTGSPVTRWREAHTDKVGTEEDVLRKLRRRIERLLHDVGVESGERVLRGQVAIVLLMIKKRE